MSSASAVDQEPLQRLEIGKPIDRELSGGESHCYDVLLAAGEYVHLVVDQRGIDVVLRVSGPDGKTLLEVDSPNGAYGPEPAFLVAKVSGIYRLDVSSPQRNAPRARYQALLKTQRPALPEDETRVEAETTLLEAEAFRGLGKKETLETARQKYETALRLFKSLGDSKGMARTLSGLGKAAFRLSDESPKALDYLDQAVLLFRSEGDRAGEADARNFMGFVYLGREEFQEALEAFQDTLEIAESRGDLTSVSAAVNNLGVVHSSWGNWRQAIAEYERALKLAREVHDPRPEVRTLANIASLHADLGEMQEALDGFREALSLHRSLKDILGQAKVLNGLGKVYLRLGDPERALEYQRKALLLKRQQGDRPGEAAVLNNIVTIYLEKGETRKASEQALELIDLSRSIRTVGLEADAILTFAKTLDQLGDKQRARDSFEKARELFRSWTDRITGRRFLGGRVGEAAALTGLGKVSLDLGDQEKAAASLKEALAVSREVKSPHVEAAALHWLAVLDRKRGDLSGALDRIEESLRVIEALRDTVGEPELRASYLATVRDIAECHTDILMRIHAAEPTGGFDARAFASSEHARARSLMELLREAQANPREGVDAALTARERRLRELLAGKTEWRLRRLDSAQTPQQVAAAETELLELMAEYQQVQARIRSQDPRFAALTRPDPLSLGEIQQELDSETVVLEYSLGEERSFLWAVTRDSLVCRELPKRSEIEAVARRVCEELGRRPRADRPESSALWREAQRLSEMVLGPVRTLLGRRRLVVVSDGALQFVPFAALPAPEAVSPALTPLLVDHEVVNLPSASVLVVLRRELAGRSPAPKTLAVLADPVFERSDERVSRTAPAGNSNQLAKAVESNSKATASETGLTRSVRDLGAGEGIWRLPFTRREAKAILRLVPATERKEALDFDASRETATGGQLSKYRYLHFATHALINDIHPELSGLVLSLVDREGREQEGFLPALEVFNLKFPAELVVLSACRTGLGREVRGEGLVGLTRGFFYAGAARVVASLWKVDDAATAELMTRFYEGMLGRQGLRPAAALRAAQLALWRQERWQAPYYWAAFLLQGEWK